MNRQDKKKIVDTMATDFKQSEASFIVAMQGMTVEGMQKLRNDLLENNGRLKVTRNTLLKRATKDLSGVDALGPYFKDQIAVVFADKDAPAVAKILVTAASKLDMLSLKAGVLEKSIISIEKIEYLAALPTREVLLAQLCGTLQAPIAGYVRILNQLIVRLLWVLQEIEKKKQ